jgi:hypothetical protein
MSTLSATPAGGAIRTQRGTTGVLTAVREAPWGLIVLALAVGRRRAGRDRADRLGARLCARAGDEASREPASEAPRTIGGLAEFPTLVIGEETLADALHLLVAVQGTGLPVLDDTKTALVGWINYQTVLAALRPPRAPI